VTTYTIKPSDMTRRNDLCYISDAIFAVLQDMGIEPESYNWELTVNVNEYEVIANEQAMGS